jgi:hypothetical protein
MALTLAKVIIGLSEINGGILGEKMGTLDWEDRALQCVDGIKRQRKGRLVLQMVKLNREFVEHVRFYMMFHILLEQDSLDIKYKYNFIKIVSLFLEF